MFRLLLKLMFLLIFFLMLLVVVFLFWNFDTEETIVAVLDTGINAEHEVFKGKLIDGYNFLDFNCDTQDLDGHGTAIAGLVVQEVENVKILPLKMLDHGKANFRITLSILYSIFKGSDVINMSFSSSTPEKPFVFLAIKLGQMKGVVFVAAAGNGGKDTVLFPASVKNVFAIGNVDYYGEFSEKSNFGDNTDFVTNGQNSALPMHDDNKNFLNKKGTSFASGRFSGYVAYLLNQNHKLNREKINEIMKKCSKTVKYQNKEFFSIQKRFLESCEPSSSE